MTEILRTFPGRLSAVRVSWQSLSAVAIAVVLFELAISDGGRALLGLTLAQTLIFALLAVMLWTSSIRRVAITLPLLAMVAAVAFTGLWTVRPEASVRELLLWTMYLGIALIVASTLTGVAAARRFLDALVVIAGWLCLIALFMFWGASNPAMRWYSTFNWPNPFAAFLLLVLPLTLVRFLQAKLLRDAIAHALVALLLAVAFLFTASRGAWVSLGAVAPLAGLLLRPRWGSAVGRLVILAILTGVSIVALTHGAAPQAAGPGMAARAVSVVDPGDYSIQGRLNFWRAGLAIFMTHPVVGTGPGTFGAVHAAYQRDVRYYARDAHSLYVQTASETGVVGLTALAVMLGILAATWVSALRASSRTQAYPLVVGIGLGLAAFFVHSGLDMDWMFPANPAMAMAMVGTLAWFAKEGVVGQAPTRSTMLRWQRLAVIGALLLAIALTQFAYLAERQFASGQHLARDGRWPEAAERYAQAARWDPWSARFLAAEADALRQVNPPRRDAAEASLRRAMAVDRMNASHPIRLASLLIDRPEPGPVALAEAEGLLTQALRLDPWNRPEAYRMLARIYVRQGRRGDAEQLYRQVVPRYLGKGLGRPTVLYAFLWPEVTGLVLDATDLAVRGGDIAAPIVWLRDVLAEDPGAAAVALRLSELEALHRPR
jgi:O-antigen ligase